MSVVKCIGGLIVVGGVFKLASMALSALNREGEDSVAVPVLVDKVSCPYCGTFYKVLTLGLMTRAVERTMYKYDGAGSVHRKPNPGFRRTHLSNPVVCPNCGRRFYVFVGVEYSKEGGFSGVHVVPAMREEVSEELLNWPHRGLVAQEAIKYSPLRVVVYRSLEELVSKEGGDIAAASLPSGDSNGVVVSEA